MADPTRPRRLPPLDSDTQTHVRSFLRFAMDKLHALITAKDPMLEIHRGAPPSPHPQTLDEALELLRASARAEVELRRHCANDQARLALDAVLLGANVSQVGHALGVSPSGVSKKWPHLGKMRRVHRWFRKPGNAADWASACAALADVAASIHYVGPDDLEVDDAHAASDLWSVIKISRDYLGAPAQQEPEPVDPEWYLLVRQTPDTVERLANPRMTKGITPEATVTLDRLRLVWRAYRAGITLEEQIQRDAHHHPGRAPGRCGP